MNPDVDVVIPTRNRQVELATTLAGLAAQTHQDFRVLVSDPPVKPPRSQSSPRRSSPSRSEDEEPFVGLRDDRALDEDEKEQL